VHGIILVGGEGTRLRPLTFTTPKAMVPILGRPFLEHMLVYLRRYGVDTVMLALGHQPAPILDYFGDGSALGISLTMEVEPQPLGSGGAIKQFEHDLREPFFAFNGDILTNMDLAAMQRGHRQSGAALSIGLIEVDEPSGFGIADLRPDGRIVRFVEKPPAAEAPSRWANAGVWLFQPEVLERIPAGRRSMVETELFPQLIAAGERLQGYAEHCFWVDIGTPERYLAVQLRLLEEPTLRFLPLDTWSGTPFLRAEAPSGQPPVVAPDARLQGPVLIGAGTRIEAGAEIQGPAALGRECRVGAGARLERAVLWDEVDLGARSVVRASVLANGCRIGAGARLFSVIAGAGAQIAANLALSDVRLDPGAVLTSRPE
jgi:mannose-1-phosphate guanylyltransferase